MTRVGVLGVGRMGLPIAVALQRAGFAVGIFDRDADRLRAARDHGLSAASDAAELVGRSEVLLTVLPDGAAVHDAFPTILGLDAGALWIDLSSGDPRLSEPDQSAARDRGIRTVSAPMGGGPSDARDRTLAFFVSGLSADVDAARPILAALGPIDAVTAVGFRAGDAQLVKLLANLLWFGQVLAATEALILGVRHGIDLNVLRDALAGSAGGSVFLDRHVDHLLTGDYLDEFELERCVVELQTVTALAREAGTPAEVSALVTKLHEEARERFGPVCGELLGARLLEQRAGIDLRVPSAL